MPHMILSEVTASVLELKRNPMGTVAAGKGSPVAIPTPSVEDRCQNVLDNFARHVTATSG